MKLNAAEILNIIINADSTNYLSHNFHPFPGKFIPQLPKYMITQFSSPGSTVLDPFCGSGTTLVEAKLLGRHSIGVDSHPLGVFMSRVKSTKLSDEDLKNGSQVIDRVQRHIEALYELPVQPKLLVDSARSPAAEGTVCSYTIPVFPNRDHWFQEHVLHELAIVHRTISDADISTRLRELLLLAFSAVVVSVSNQESDTRYAAINKIVPRMRPFMQFRDKARDMLTRIEEFNRVASDSLVELYHADGRYLDMIRDDQADMLVTSPPYPNTYDYYLYHKLRMFWLGLDWRGAKHSEIGSRLSHSSQRKGVDTYLNQMTECFQQSRRILKPGGVFAIVIGDSIIRGLFFRGDAIVDELARRTGFAVEDEVKYSQNYASKAFNPAFRNKSKEEHILLLVNRK